MERLAQIATEQGGNILEIGYGMGIASDFIQSSPKVDSHTVIECHPDVATRCLEDRREQLSHGRIHLLTGFWHEVTQLLGTGTFNGILFDTYPIREEELIGAHRFFFSEAFRLLAPSGVLTYYSNEAAELSNSHVVELVNAGFSLHDIRAEVFHVSPPLDCEYWHNDTIVAPRVRKPASARGLVL